MKRHCSIRCAFTSSLAAITLITSHAAAIVIYVDDDAPPGGDGLTWNTAYTFLQDALAFAAVPTNQVTSIRIGQGEYKPDRDAAHPNGTGDRAASFQLVKNLLVAGGYAGYQAIDPDARSFVEFETILNGDLAGDDHALPGLIQRGENSRHVVQGFQVDGGTIDGLTISGGNADDSTHSPDDRGGGLLLRDRDNLFAFTNFEVTNCTIRDNFAVRSGGGMQVEYVDTVNISQCTFHENTGTGLSTNNSHTYIDHSTFRYNLRGGVNGYWSLTITDSLFEANEGRAVSAGHADMARCEFRSNVGEDGGATLTLLRQRKCG